MKKQNQFNQKLCLQKFNDQWKEPFMPEYAECNDCYEPYHCIRYDGMIFMKDRWNTFEFYLYPLSTELRRVLALSGFFYDKDLEEIFCYSCGMCFVDDPLNAIHLSHKCKHIKMLRSWCSSSHPEITNKDIMEFQKLCQDTFIFYDIVRIPIEMIHKFEKELMQQKPTIDPTNCDK